MRWESMMPDMLVKLYRLPDLSEAIARTSQGGVDIRRPAPTERVSLLEWVERNFSPGWAAECAAAFVSDPPTCFLATAGQRVIGFACYDCTRPNFFGPTGVAEKSRGQGVGRALLLSCLHAMYRDGYAYAIIGGVGPAEYYAKTVGATLIDGSSPGIYTSAMRRNPGQ